MSTRVSFCPCLRQFSPAFSGEYRKSILLQSRLNFLGREQTLFSCRHYLGCGDFSVWGVIPFVTSCHTSLYVQALPPCTSPLAGKGWVLVCFLQFTREQRIAACVELRDALISWHLETRSYFVWQGRGHRSCARTFFEAGAEESRKTEKSAFP